MAPNTPDFELQVLPPHGTHRNNGTSPLPESQVNLNNTDGLVPEHGFSLPPADSGKDAYLFLLAAFIIEALVWGKQNFIQIRYAHDH